MDYPALNRCGYTQPRSRRGLARYIAETAEHFATRIDRLVDAKFRHQPKIGKVQ